MKILKSINIKKAVANNFWLKIIALGIAILVWFYVSRLITGPAMSV